MLSLWILVTMVIGRKHFSDRLSHCLFLLTSGYFLWLAAILALYPVKAAKDVEAWNWPIRITTLCEATFSQIVLAGTVCVALERNFKIRQESVEATRKYFVITLAVAATFAIAFAPIYLSSVISESGRPMDHPQSEIWTVLATLDGGITGTTTAWLYIRTYFYAKKALAMLPPEKEALRIKAITTMIALDGIITPLLIIFFMPNIRRSLLSFGKGAAGMQPPVQRNDDTRPKVEIKRDTAGYKFVKPRFYGIESERGWI
ncbi:hypothetical protein BDR26DRAFT_875698, partial [Obelidium mucronatum]